MKGETNNLLYIYLQRKLLEAANGITAKRGFLSEDQKIEKIDELKDAGKLVTEMPFTEAKKVLNYWHNIANKVVVPCLYVMRDLELIEIEGKYNHMKVKIVNVHRGNLIKETNKMYSVCF